MTACSLDGTTVSGSNADLNDPVGWAIRQLSGTVTTVTSVADADVATVASADTDALFDLTELRALESALENLDVVDIQLGPEKESLDQLGKRLETIITRKRKLIERNYGIGLSSIETGTILLGFQQRTPPEV